MLDSTRTQFSHVKPGDTPWRGDGLRAFFLYRDLGVEAATGGKVVCQLVKANQAPETGTGWHRHGADFTSTEAEGPCAVPAPTPW